MREFKDSNLDWIGEIPQDWKIMPIKYFTSIFSGDFVIKTLLDDDFDFPVFNGASGNSGFYNKYNFEGNMTLVSSRGNAGFTHFYQGKCWIGNSCFAVKPTSNNIDWKYLYYALKHNESKLFYEKNTTTIPAVSLDQLKNSKICVPSLEEQTLIANFLDVKCNAIDELQSDLTNQISTLESYKKSLITETVTKGLDKNVEMKDSGIEWLGKIPSHWTRKRIKYATSLIASGTTPTSSMMEYYDGSFNWIQSGDLYKTKYIKETKEKITEKALKEKSTLKIYKAPFIVIAMYGASVGNTSISEVNACCNQACCCIKPNKKNELQFLYYWIEASKDFLLSQAIGGTQPNISQDKIKNLIYYEPPINEQQRIADYLDERCSKIDEIIETKRKQLETLNEYKKSLIYEYVTGKKEVK